MPWSAHAADLEMAASQGDLALVGAWALDQGALFTCMILAAATVAILTRQWRQAAIWFVIAAVLSLTGLMHGYAYTAGDVALKLGPAWPWAISYLVIAGLMLLAPYVSQPSAGADNESDQSD